MTEEQRDLFPLPHRLARRSDPETSHEAAQSVSAATRWSQQQAVLSLLRRWGPQTDEDLALSFRAEYQIPASDSGLRTRRSELVRAGFVRDTGRRTKTESGRRAIVWEALS